LPDNPVESFRTHKNYLNAFDKLLIQIDSSRRPNFYHQLNQRILSSGILPETERSGVDYQQIRRSLHSAWGTEFILLSTKRLIEEDELIRLSNNWSCIQTYYIFYYCTQSLVVAKWNQRPESHPKTQNIFYDLWGSRSFCMPPWTFVCSSNGFLNIPEDIDVDASIHVWSVCDYENKWNLAGKALMTSRREVFKEKQQKARESKRSEIRREWKREERVRIANGRRPRRIPSFRLPRLTAEEKQRIDSRLRPFTLMDYLYRLRIKTNYVDSDMFTDGPEFENGSKNVRSFFNRIASGTLFLHELAICNLVGRTRFQSWVSDWIEQNVPVEMQNGLVARRDFFNDQ